MKKFISITAICLAITMALTSCAAGGGKDPNATPTPPPSPDPELTKNTVSATIVLENGGEIGLELYPDLAPETVENFVSLAEDGFYDGTIFHRVIEGFMIQGGGYDERLAAKKADNIYGEFAMNGFENTLAHVRGVISMARAQDVNSASSQFFIVQQDATYLDGQYAAFGRVTEGLEVVDEFAAERTGSVSAQGMDDVPVDAIVIETVTVNSDGGSTDKKKSAKSDKDSAKPAKESEKPAKASTKPSKGEDYEDIEDDNEDIAKLFENYTDGDL